MLLVAWLLGLITAATRLAPSMPRQTPRRHRLCRCLSAVGLIFVLTGSGQADPATQATDHMNRQIADMPSAQSSAPAATAEVAIDAEPPATLDKPPPAWPLIEEILSVLSEQELLNDADPVVRKQLVDAILKAAGYGSVFVPEGAAPPAQVQPPEQHADASTLFQSQTVHDVFDYFILGTVSEENALAFATAIAEAENAHHHGLILDLRCAGGSDGGSAVNIAGALAQVKLPLAVLINGDTTLASELLASLLSARQNTVLFGSPTSGRPFNLKEFPLQQGGTLLVPDHAAPGSQLTWPPSPVIPDIHMPSEMTCEALRNLRSGVDTATQLERDSVLRKAADLLIMICGLKARPG
jgi:hypothetical protein